MAFEYPSTKTARKEKKQKELDNKVKKIGKNLIKKFLNFQDLKKHSYMQKILMKV